MIAVRVVRDIGALCWAFGDLEFLRYPSLPLVWIGVIPYIAYLIDLYTSSLFLNVLQGKISKCRYLGTFFFPFCFVLFICILPPCTQFHFYAELLQNWHGMISHLILISNDFHFYFPFISETWTRFHYVISKPVHLTWAHWTKRFSHYQPMPA